MGVRLRQSFAVGLSLCVIAAACGDDDDEDASLADTQSEVPAATTVEPTAMEPDAATTAAGSGNSTAAPTTVANSVPADIDPDGVIRIATFLDIIGGTTFDPALSGTVRDEEYLMMIYGALLQLNDEGVYEPWLAESFTVRDPNTVVVVLREGLEFSDGTPYDAAAVRAGMLRTRDEASEEAARSQPQLFRDNLQDIVVVDPLTLEFQLNQPVAGQFLSVLGGHESMVPSPAADPANLSTEPVGAGPFVLSEFEPQSRIVLSRNEAYFDPDSYRFGALEFLHTPPGTQRANALLSGQADVAYPVVLGDVSLFEGGDNYSLLEYTKEFGYTVLQPCSTKPPLDDVRVRQAISLAIDRDVIDELTLFGFGERKRQVFGHQGIHTRTEPEGESYDVEQAKALMEEAGVGQINLDLAYAANLPYEQLSEVLRAQLSEIGVNLNVIESQDVLAEFVEPQKPGILLVGGSRAGLDKYLRYFGEDGAQNICDGDYSDVVQQLVDVAGLAPDDPRVAETFKAVDRQVTEDYVIIPLNFFPEFVAYDSSRIKGEVTYGSNLYKYDLAGAYVAG